MLRVYFGELKDDRFIFNPDVFFNNTYEDEWITDELSVELIREIDKSEVIGPHLIESPFLGPIPPEKLSGGVKTLILVNNDPEHIFNASACGNNCAPWLLKIADGKDVTVRLGYYMDFGDSFELEVLNTGRIIHSMAELTEEIIDYHLLGA